METDLVISGLSRKRDEIDADIKQVELRLLALRTDRAVIEAAIRVCDPSRDGAAPLPRPKGGNLSQYFEQGELARRCRDLLRAAAGGSVTTVSAINAILTAKGFDPADAAMRRDFGQRVLGAFYRMAQKGELRRTGEGLEASWHLA
jgi:hypothetical protein